MGEIVHGAILAPGPVRVREGDLDGSGALLSGRNVDIALSGDLVNSGTIAGREVVRITAENIDNLSGRIHGGDAGLQARTDLNNISGTISANSMLVATAGRDLNNVTGVAGIERTGGAASVLGRVAGLYVTGDAGGRGSLLRGWELLTSAAQVSSRRRISWLSARLTSEWVRLLMKQY